jgi:hypothetical protein
MLVLANGDFHIDLNLLVAVFPLMTLALVVMLVVWLAKR